MRKIWTKSVAVTATTGALVVVRPDQYVGTVLPLTAREELERYFAGILTPVSEPTDTHRSSATTQVVSGIRRLEGAM